MTYIFILYHKNYGVDRVFTDTKIIVAFKIIACL
jgi:hypothetical protein